MHLISRFTAVPEFLRSGDCARDLLFEGISSPCRLFMAVWILAVLLIPPATAQAIAMNVPPLALRIATSCINRCAHILPCLWCVSSTFLRAVRILFFSSSPMIYLQLTVFLNKCNNTLRIFMNCNKNKPQTHLPRGFARLFYENV